ncbi:hypothetical protein GUJ93_ZPchr0002g23032 [Zizania palustris]|uniref:Uncharacterized protein n=1 Tax=Zizania palustris TaxID=103762 RepID=A0A8J5S3K3_ZIZPA|nr:hypothetical protein GUJ93_ZPchr0002g23032 [Zizania palustris]
MAEPTAAADIAAPPPPAPEATATATAMDTVVAEQKVSPTAPQPDVPAPPAAAKKRKLEEVGFHTSAYYKIRAAVADLRVRFVQVYEATDFQNNDAACEILKAIEVAWVKVWSIRGNLYMGMVRRWRCHWSVVTGFS